jgi:hypothetical protein
VPLRAALPLACFAWLALAPALAQAEDPALHVTMPAECGSASALARDVAQLLGALPEALAWPPLELSVAPLASGYRLQLALPTGERTLEDADCQSLFRAAVVMVAAAFAGSQEAQGQEASTPADETRHALALSPPVSAAPARASALSAPSPGVDSELRFVPRASRSSAHVRSRPDAALDDPPPAQRGRAHALLGAGAGLVLGLVPGVGIDIELLAGVRITRVELALVLRYLPPREAGLDDGAVRVQALGSTLGAAYALLPWLRLGAGLDAYGLRGSAQGLAGARDDWAFTLGPRVESWAALVRRRHGELALGVSGFYQPRPAAFVSSQGDTLYAASSFGFQAGARAAWDFF